MSEEKKLINNILPKLVDLALRNVEKTYEKLFDESDDCMGDGWVIKKELSPIAILLLSKRIMSTIKTLRSAERMLKRVNATEEELLVMEQEDEFEMLVKSSSKDNNERREKALGIFSSV